MGRTRTLTRLGLLALLAGLAVAGLGACSRTPLLPLAVGTRAPGVVLEDAWTGARTAVPGDLEGKPFGLLFFSYG